MTTTENNADKAEHLAALTYYAGQLADAQEHVHAHVIMARQTGASWEEIGKILGVTKQAAHQRYATSVRESRAERYAAAENAWSTQDSDPSPEMLAVEATLTEDDIAEARGYITPSIFLEAPAPAKPVTAAQESMPFPPITAEQRAKRSKKVDAPAPETLRQTYVIPIPDTTAQPGIGKGQGPHTCPACGSSNHKTEHRELAAFTAECVPTQYDPPKIAYLMWTTEH